MKKIAILGSTGSIGETTLKIIKKDKKNLKINLLTTNKNINKIFKQAKEFKVRSIIISDTISNSDLDSLGINKEMKLRFVNSGMKKYLKRHRENLI